MEVYCGHCGAVNRKDRVFCLRCRKRLFPTTRLDLTLDDFVYPGDRTNLSVIEDAGWLPALFAGERIKSQERSMRHYLARSAIPVENFSDLDLCMREHGDKLGLGILPDAFVLPTKAVNAAVMGSERHPVFMVTLSALQLLNHAEVGMLVGHELAHIKSRHMLYHTAAESIAAGGGLLASFFGGGLITYPLQMSLLAWHRESEATADRAALLLGGDLKAFNSMLTKIVLSNGEEQNPGTLSQLFRTHPDYGRRLQLAKEFCSSPEYSRGRAKLRLRGQQTSVPVCSSCGAPKQPRANYCGTCGRSLN